MDEMQVSPDSKHALKALYQEIDLYDRKIAHCQKFASYDSETSRNLAVKKLMTKRAALVKNALELTTNGIECDAKYLPRSFKAAANEETS